MRNRVPSMNVVSARSRRRTGRRNPRTHQQQDCCGAALNCRSISVNDHGIRIGMRDDIGQNVRGFSVISYAASAKIHQKKQHQDREKVPRSPEPETLADFPSRPSSTAGFPPMNSATESAKVSGSEGDPAENAGNSGCDGLRTVRKTFRHSLILAWKRLQIRSLLPYTQSPSGIR